MKFSLITLAACATSLVAAAPPVERDLTELSDTVASIHHFIALEKRKGGGGKGGGGGSSGGSSGGKGSSGGTSGGSSGSRGPGSSTSNTGGRTTTGSGPPPAYGNRYAGGATTPYKAGGNAPTRNIAPYAIGGAAIGGFGAYYAAAWIFPVYAYSYPIGYHWYGDGRNHTSNVTCVCQSEQTCGCDPTDDQAFLATLLTGSANGTGAPVNSSIVKTAVFANGSANTYINGSLQNGTTAAGGTVDPNAASIRIISHGGYALMAATVLFGVFM